MLPRLFWSGDNNVALSSSLNCNFLDPPWQTNRNDNPIMFFNSAVLFSPGSLWEMFVCVFLLRALFSFAVTDRTWNQFSGTSVSVGTVFLWLIPASFFFFFVFIVVMCARPRTGQLKESNVCCFFLFFSRAEFTLSSLASLRGLFHLLWERYVHLFFLGGKGFSKHWHFGIFLLSLSF